MLEIKYKILASWGKRLLHIGGSQQGRYLAGSWQGVHSAAVFRCLDT